MSNRALGRNVHIYDAKDHDTVLGGLVLTNGMTNNNFYAMKAHFLRDESGATVQRGDHPRQQEKYFTLVRTTSVTTGTPLAEFRDAVRERDRRCIITGNCQGFEAVHIFFPLAYITMPPKNGGSINSARKGIFFKADIFLTATMCRLTQMYDNYKIVCFRPNGDNIAGAHLDNQFHEHPSRPVDQLLRWHISQTVLANVRRKGEPALECDFPHGSDMIGEIMNGLKAGERMECELFGCLAGYSEIK
ncbi:hypothetical protein L873DRAFT_1839177 [Choiromyces venosus 120613-1]|uniref:DUF7881 domain-containing protein n=1 Tax=Choiromyces venosus 120613-1 TaxID=1336337 RepID=A0A3N4J714_9PEZI|nr:hypothetical protein L873DRAFT_1839177 [Choiromyces venosus 120613-1]